jgi:hypothetical protein
MNEYMTLAELVEYRNFWSREIARIESEYARLQWYKDVLASVNERISNML